MTLITTDKFGIGVEKLSFELNGKKMELTSLPDNEWGRVVEDSKKVLG